MIRHRTIPPKRYGDDARLAIQASIPNNESIDCERGRVITSAKELKEKHRAVYDPIDENARVRVHRAISWLDRSERETEDPAARFIFLWISLNAAYAREFGHEMSERDQARDFIARILKCDKDRRIHAALFETFNGPIRLLIDNKFIFEPFWKAVRDHDASGAWRDSFESARGMALKAIVNGETELLMSIVADRLYVLRNQLVHGGATWNSAANRQQLADAVAILSTLMPIIIELMIDCPEMALENDRINYPWIRDAG